MRASLVGLLTLLGLVPAAHAARIPSAEESAALEAILTREVGDTCDGWYKRSRPLPLVADDGTWGIATTVCQHGKVPSGAGTAVWTVWAYRSSATSTDWTMVRPSGASRVPPCIGDDGLFNTVPETVVRELRERCANPSASHGYEPIPILTLSVFRDRRHRYDFAPWVSLYALTDVGRRASGSFSMSADDPRATLKLLRDAFGTPRRAGCRARWSRLGLTATACKGQVTKLVLGAPWRLERDAEEDRDTYTSGQEVLVGDPVPLARYLDARLAKLPTSGRLRLPYMRIGTRRVAVHVVTRADRITAIEVVRAPGPR